VNIIDRAHQLIVQPKREWGVIAAEPHTVQDLYTTYVMILAAIPAVSYFIGFSIVGGSMLGVGYRVPIAHGVAHMVSQYVLSLGLVYVFAVLIDALAPQFGGEKNLTQSFKVAAFAPTALWLAGIFYVIPALSILFLLGLYSLYLLYTGLPILKRVPEDKAVPFVAIVLIAAIVLGVLVSALAALMIPTTVRGF
jgi:Yip1-like protein